MKRILTAAILLVFVFSLFGCSSKPAAKEETGGVSRPEPVAQLSPADVDPGRQKNSGNTSDLWYPDSGNGSYFYLRSSPEFTITFVNGTEKKTFNCSATDDKHLIPEGEGAFDIVFYDAFNCYDFESKEWYTRGNVNKTKAAFAGRTLANTKDSENLYIFNADGTVTEKYKGAEYTGSWKLTAETVIVFTFANDKYDYTFDIDMNSAGTIIGFSQRGGREFRFIT
ncbi:MAG: hypothetical protein IJ264_04135 [Clostridia bacterium]|nr:hypothetical protein [Clostridia bacterium]